MPSTLARPDGTPPAEIGHGDVRRGGRAALRADRSEDREIVRGRNNVSNVTDTTDMAPTTRTRVCAATVAVLGAAGLVVATGPGQARAASAEYPISTCFGLSPNIVDFPYIPRRGIVPHHAGTPHLAVAHTRHPVRPGHPAASATTPTPGSTGTIRAPASAEASPHTTTSARPTKAYTTSLSPPRPSAPARYASPSTPSTATPSGRSRPPAAAEPSPFADDLPSSARSAS